MSVRTALQLINRFLAEDDFDHDTQFCLHWFEQQAGTTGKFGEADTLARAKGTSVGGVQATGVVESGGGNCGCCDGPSYPPDWDPDTDTRLPVWEALHHLIRALNQGGESAAGALLAAHAAPRPKPTRRWRTASTRCASAKAGPRTPVRTTNSSPRGAASRSGRRSGE